MNLYDIFSHLQWIKISFFKFTKDDSFNINKYATLITNYYIEIKLSFMKEENDYQLAIIKISNNNNIRKDDI